ncbi:LemA family protein, partial [Micromonospora zhanjiangensis]
MSTGLAFLAVLALLAVAVVGWAVATYNRLVRLRTQVRASWAQVDVQLKRRHSLIPNLVETVRGYAAHERGTLEAVTAARSAAAGSA